MHTVEIIKIMDDKLLNIADVPPTITKRTIIINIIGLKKMITFQSPPIF